MLPTDVGSYGSVLASPEHTANPKLNLQVVVHPQALARCNRSQEDSSPKDSGATSIPIAKRRKTLAWQF